MYRRDRGLECGSYSAVNIKFFPMRIVTFVLYLCQKNKRGNPCAKTNNIDFDSHVVES